MPQVVWRGQYSSRKQVTQVQEAYLYLIAGFLAAILVAWAFNDYYKDSLTSFADGTASKDQESNLILILIGSFIVQFVLVVWSGFVRDAEILGVMFFAYSSLEGISLGLVITLYAGLPGGMEIIYTALLWTVLIFAVIAALSHSTQTTKKQFKLSGYIFLMFFVIMMVLIIMAFFIQSEVLFNTFTLLSVGFFSFSIFFFIQANKHIKQPPVRLAWGLFIAVMGLFYSMLRLIAITRR